MPQVKHAANILVENSQAEFKHNLVLRKNNTGYFKAFPRGQRGGGALRKKINEKYA